MRKLFLVPLAVACTLVAASASAAEVETLALFDLQPSRRRKVSRSTATATSM